MARIDLGVATSVLATFLGSDPIFVGATDEQKKQWITRIAEEGLLFAYGATEPEAGSDLGALEDDRRRRCTTAIGSSATGSTAASSGSATAGSPTSYTILANAPGGPTWFVVERGRRRLHPGKPEDKHGIRLSNTAALFLDDVYVDADRLVGGVEGQGLMQAQQVFGYTRLMVAAFGLGGGWAALDRAIEYSKERIQAGGPLSEKQGYTHKLIVPHAVRLEAARAYIEETAERIDAGEGSLNTEGAIAKYLATEAGIAAGDAAIQALGGYGYTREYMVEKIRRDTRITTIYEGTSEIMEMTIARDRWQQHLKTRGQHYHDAADEMQQLHARAPRGRRRRRGPRARTRWPRSWSGAGSARLTRNQHVLFRLGELIAYGEVAACVARKAARAAQRRAQREVRSAFRRQGPRGDRSRVRARRGTDGSPTTGCASCAAAGGADDDRDRRARQLRFAATRSRPRKPGSLDDMDHVADLVYGRVS